MLNHDRNVAGKKLEASQSEISQKDSTYPVERRDFGEAVRERTKQQS